jgi:Transcriptional regulator, AbiEi antitoxin
MLRSELKQTFCSIASSQGGGCIAHCTLVPAAKQPSGTLSSPAPINSPSWMQRGQLPPYGYIIYIFRFYRNMSFTYNDALSSLFAGESFTSREFARRTGNPRAAKILSELKHRGLVERLGRGTYRCLSPGDRPDLRSAEWARVRDVVLSGPKPKAWAGETAVELWTAGRYKVAPSLYSRVFSLAIPYGREGAWKEYLARHGVSTTNRKRVGARVELLPRPKVSATSLDGEPVVPRREVEALIAAHPALYGDAKELILGRP